MNTSNLSIPQPAIDDFCRRWKVTEMSLFGSILRDDFDGDSDVDILLDFAPDAHWSLFDLVDMKEQLTQLFGRKVDVVTKNGLKSSQNQLLREEILSTARAIHRDAA